MTYTEKELDQFLHGISLSLLSKKSAQHWRYDEETAKEIEWLEVLERKVRADKADRKTEPTISKMEQVDKDINVRSKDERQTKGVWNAGYKTGYDKGYKDAQKVKDSQYLVKDLVKAFCEDGTWLEHQGVYTLTLAEAKQRAVDIIESVLAKEEPQAYVINPQEPTNDEKCFECDDFFTYGGQCNKIKDEPQAGEMMTEEEFDSMLARVLTGKNEPQTDYERGYQDGIKDEIDKHHIGRRKRGRVMIDINQKDFGTLCICALRYCHGRRTYMPSHIQHIVMAHFKDLSDQDLKVIADDEQFQSDMSLWGDYCDLVDWKNFYQILREAQAERESE